MWFFRKFRIKYFKRVKLRKERVRGDRKYLIHFSLVLNTGKNSRIENLEVTIPAKSVYDAKKKLLTFLKLKTSYDIHKIEEIPKQK